VAHIQSERGRERRTAAGVHGLGARRAASFPCHVDACTQDHAHRCMFDAQTLTIMHMCMCVYVCMCMTCLSYAHTL
jgi:hypothetical protein